MTQLQTRVAFTTGIIAILGGAFLLQSQYLLWGEWSFDQGHNLLIAYLMDYGYAPYTEIFMDRPPLFFWNIGPAFTFFRSVEGLQLVMIGYSILTIAALIAIGTSLDGKLTGLLTGALLAFNFFYFIDSRKVMPEIPAIGLAFIALSLALHYQTLGRLFRLIASGAAMGGSLLVNYFMPWIIPVIVLVLAVPPHQIHPLWPSKLHRQRIVYNWLIWGAILLLVAFASWFVYNVKSVLDQAILFHLSKTQGTERIIAENIILLWQRLISHPLLSICSILGLIISLRRFRDFGYIVVTWFGLTLAVLILYSPLRSKHLILLPPILALLTAIGLSYLLWGWFTLPPKNRLLNWGGQVGSVLLLALLFIELMQPYHVLSRPRRKMIDEEMQPLVNILDKFTTPTDCLITDNPYLAFVANRMPPPWLSNLSYARFQSGYMDTQTLIDITNTYNCQLIAPVLDRIKNSERLYYDWAKGHYLRVWVVDGKEVMLGKPLQEANPNITLGANFAEQVELIGADWLPGKDGGYLSLYWRTLRPFSQNYKIFVQLRNTAGQTIASADHEAYDGLIPTQTWPVDAIFKDTNHLDFPTDLQGGTYSLYVGIYDPNTLERLPIINDTSGENAAIISEIEIR